MICMLKEVALVPDVPLASFIPHSLYRLGTQLLKQHEEYLPPLCFISPHYGIFLLPALPSSIRITWFAL